jgi:hypothetical protein
MGAVKRTNPSSFLSRSVAELAQVNKLAEKQKWIDWNLDRLDWAKRASIS